jgi:hypothetical protein
VVLAFGGNRAPGLGRSPSQFVTDQLSLDDCKGMIGTDVPPLLRLVLRGHAAVRDRPADHANDRRDAPPRGGV